MSKKHFVALAKAIQAEKPTIRRYGKDYDGALAMWQTMAVMIASECAAFNVKFDRDRFLHACDYLTTEELIALGFKS